MEFQETQKRKTCLIARPLSVFSPSCVVSMGLSSSESFKMAMTCWQKFLLALRWFKRAFHALCFLLFVYQTFEAIMLYNEYSVNVDVNYERQTVASAPAFTFCNSDKRHLIKAARQDPYLISLVLETSYYPRRILYSARNSGLTPDTRLRVGLKGVVNSLL